ncbi:unnamed protein product, partial [marine sediment metagenome]
MKVGAKPKYKTVAALEERIDNYFYDSVYDEDGKEREKRKHVSVTGLALHLGFESRQSITDYQERDEFFSVIRKAKLMIENYLEEKLFNNNVAGVIFNLKNNYDWKDKTEVDIGNTVVKVKKRRFDGEK